MKLIDNALISKMDLLFLVQKPRIATSLFLIILVQLPGWALLLS